MSSGSSRLALLAAFIVVAVVAAAVAVVVTKAVGSGASPTLTPTATPTAIVSPTPTSPPPTPTSAPNANAALTSVQDVVCYSTPHQGGPQGCHQGTCYQAEAQWFGTAGCPLTPRLAERLHYLTRPRPAGGGGFDPICRCQAVASTVSFSVLQNTSTQEVVKVTYTFGTSSYAIDFAAVNQGGAWRVDDTYCDRDPAKSIYLTPVPACA
ncbi:MAG TPA: hypothetical protein VFB34_14090 [Chloroflexota bacterium]|nr:hypothetical protein [Chloroflexota bacterium]